MPVDVLTLRRREHLEQLHVEWAWRKAAADPRWFFENMLWIPSQRDPRGREPFNLMDHQAGDLEAFTAYQYVIVLKARQLGESTLVMAYALWLALFRPGSVILVFSKNQEAANKALSMSKVMWQFLPPWVKARAPDLAAESTRHMLWKFKDGITSTVKSFAATKTAGAGETATLVVLDEMALYPDPEETYRTAMPTTDAGGQLIIISTARGAYNRFAQTYRAAQREENGFWPIFHPWHQSPFVDQATYDAKQKDFIEEPWLFHAEYPASEDEAFRESGRPRFPDLPAEEDCEELPVRGEMHIDEYGQISFKDDPDGPLRLTYDALAPGRRDYVLSVDPATGVGLDYTAAVVLAATVDGEPEVVGYWHHNAIEPVDVARRMDLLGRHFAGPGGPALIVPEKVGGWADALINELHRTLNYPRIYMHRPTGHRKRATPLTFGFPLSQLRRPLVIDRLAGYVANRDGEGPRLGGIFPALRQELSQFVIRDDGKVAADVGCHDDLVMSTAIGVWVLVEQGGAGATDERIGEAAGQVYDLSHIFEEAEAVRVTREREYQQMLRRWSRTQRHAARGRT